MTTATTQIANHLNIIDSAIVRVEEWANVLFVVAKGLGGRFVSKKVVKEVKKMETPKLTGSEKQIEWANKIRENSFAKFAEFAQTKSKDAPTGQNEAFVKSIVQFLEVIASEKTEAAWWIKWRSENGAKTYNLITPDFFWTHRKEFRSEWQQILVNNGLVK